MLSDKSPRYVMGYVDNFEVLATTKEAAWTGAEAIRKVLASKGLRVHPTESSSGLVDFLGLQFNLVLQTVRVKPSRAVRLRVALKQLSQRGHASGALLEIIVGHCTWAAMLRREALSCFRGCYGFIK